MRPNLPTRRLFLLSSAAFLGACSAARAAEPQGPADSPAAWADSDWRRISDAEWRRRLSPEAYRVLRRHGTERAFTSPLTDEKRAGTYHCAGCDLPLFSSDTKFDSGTGWPSFWTHLPGAFGTSIDRSFFMVRTEYHCARCLGHHGHVFDDWPSVPTGQRWCNNGVALRFRPAAEG
ncbi:peptide-methionine (R)-S-oxide reductase MsrB [Hyphomonas sp.]|uniref:peptide-methionine (R)-S-oxide reductase MsrB n=1 Tax=Hyphomonas sp. TaxID=87 RepID=UPI003918E125